MPGQAEVRLTLKTGDYQLLLSLLKLQAQMITAEEATVILKTLGYSNIDQVTLERQLVYCAEQLVNAVK